MNGILILAHGSRQKSTEDVLHDIVNELKEQFEGWIIETAFLQFSKTSLKTGMDKLRQQGISNIKIIPYFLFDGIHINETIPQEVEEFLNENPGIEVSIGKTIGYDKRMVEILADRVREMA